MIAINTVRRRYTPPTCTLQVQARRSPLSRWQAKPVVKDLRFELRFDDPRQLRERHEQVAITGDRDQLEALCDTVATYIQDVVLQASAATPLQTTPTAPRATHPLPPSPRRRDLDAAPATDPVIPTLVSRARGLYLESQGLLQHQLHFGSLAPTLTQTSVQLSTTQLFDLATALDEYSSEVEALPKLPAAAGLPGTGWPSWASTAASVIVALGLTTAAIRLSSSWQGQTGAEAPTISRENAPILEGSPLGIEAVPPLPEAPPVPTALLPPELEGLEALPPPGAVGRLEAPLPQTADTRYRGGSSTTPGPAETSTATPEAAPDSPPPIAGSSSETPPGQGRLVLPSPDSTPSLPRNLPPVATAPRPAPLVQPEAAAGSRSPAPAPAPPRSSAPAPPSRQPSPLPSLPQVAEVRQYFQGRWQPSEALSGPIEYRLWLNRNGSLQRIAPASRQAATYLDRTRMPLLGEPFVSPLEGSGTPQIRLVLGVDGSVQAYLEALE